MEPQGLDHPEVEPDEGSLEALKQDGSSLLDLLGVLLSPKTFPHVVLLAAMGLLLYWMSINDGEEFAAQGYISLAGGYIITGLLSHVETIQRWTQLQDSENDQRGWLHRMLVSFRICLFPAIMAGLTFVLLRTLIGEGGLLGNWLSLLPVGLGFGFVAWAVIQGLSVGRWLSRVSAGRLPSGGDRQNPSTMLSSGGSFVAIMLLAVGLLMGFEWLASVGQAPNFSEVLLEHPAFFVVVGGVFFLAWKRTEPNRREAAKSNELHSFAGRWMFLSQVLISWHLFTVWRHLVLSQNNSWTMIEEVLLMMFTIIMAIWSLTSRSFKSPLNLLSTTNALPIGLAFGYAYAGSVAMVSGVLGNVEQVFITGHIIVVLTLLWMQPRVLSAVVGRNHEESAIKAMVERTQPAEGTDATPPLSGDQERPEDAVVQSATEESTNPDEAGNFPEFQGVEWKEPEVLATDVDWDDEVELVDQSD